MQNVLLRRARWALLIAATAALTAQLPSIAMAHGTRQHVDDSEQGRAGYGRSVHAYAIPDVTLMDANGASVSLRSELESDVPVMMNFIFTSCAAVCPVLSATFSQAQNRLQSGRGDFRMVSITIDPEHDTPARLREYAALFHGGDRWRFLTGTLSDVLSVQRGFDAFRGDKTNHVPLTYLRASSGSPWIRLEGFTTAEDLVREFRALRPD